MFRYCFILALLGAVSAGIFPIDQDLSAGRIVNGIETTIRQRPYQASLQAINSTFHFCGGSIIAENIILTAAHCAVGQKPEKLQIRLGSTLYSEGGKLVKVKAIKVHEQYSRATLKYDVAIMKLDESVEESDNIRYVELATEPPKTGTPAVVSGWGDTCHADCDGSKVLMEVELSFLNREECASKDYKYGNKIRETMVCAYTETKDSCQGDSGGPLVAEGKQVGIVSWGHGCGEKGYPGVYSDISVLREWILESAKEI